MRILRSLYHLARADFLERVRRYSFLVLLALTIYLAYMFVPPAGANYQTVALGDARGIYNSVWVGTMFGMMISTLVSLLAFYPIKNAVAHDRQTQVGQIIAATPMRKVVYVLGKWLSNVAVLTLLLVAMTGVAVVMQWIRAEDPNIQLWTLAKPLWLMSFPVMALVAAVAVLFECIPFLRGGFGNIVYFGLYMVVLVTLIEGTSNAEGLVVPSNDLFGFSHVMADMQRVVKQYIPDYSGQFTIGGAELTGDAVLFQWSGVKWTWEMILQRLSYVGVAALLAAAAMVPFDRFDPAKTRLRRRQRKPDPSPEAASSASKAVPTLSTISLTPLPKRTFRGRFGGVLLAELRLMFKGVPWWWMAIALGLSIAGAAVPAPDIQPYLLAAAWFWPILLWSKMGCREQQRNTQQIIFSTARPVGRQLLGAWLAGFSIAIASGAGAALRMAFTGQWGMLAAWSAGALFIPSFALAAGVWSGGSRLFEVCYTLLWYIGPANRVWALDFTGLNPESIANGVPSYFLLATFVLLGLAVLGRKRRA